MQAFFFFNYHGERRMQRRRAHVYSYYSDREYSSVYAQRLFPLSSAMMRQVLSYARRHDAASATRWGFQNSTRGARDGVFSIVFTVAGIFLRRPGNSTGPIGEGERIGAFAEHISGNHEIRFYGRLTRGNELVAEERERGKERERRREEERRARNEDKGYA